MSARKRRDKRQAERAQRPETVYRSRSLARFIRKSCSRCGGPRIQWGDVELLSMAVGAAAVQRALADLGPDGGPAAECWWCLDCAEWGVFGLCHEEWDEVLDARRPRGQRGRPAS
jgi:hypothetical protein